MRVWKTTNRFGMKKRLMAATLWAMMPVFAGTTGAQTTLVHYKFKFGSTSNPTPAGYIKVSPANLYTKAYAVDTVVGYYGFQNWQHNRLGVVDRGGSDTLHRDFITNFDSADIMPAVFYHNSPFYFSVNVPEGKYRAKITMGDPLDTAVTTDQRRNPAPSAERLCHRSRAICHENILPYSSRPCDQGNNEKRRPR